MRRVFIGIEDQSGLYIRVVRVISPELLDTCADPGGLLKRQYDTAKKEMSGLLRKARLAGPKGKLP